VPTGQDQGAAPSAAVADSAEPAAAPATPAPTTPAPTTPEASKLVVVPPPTPSTAPATPSSPRLSADELKELEAHPGATQALEQRNLPAPPAVAGLAGAPGPSPASGPDDATVKLVIFSDFQCPVCRRAAEPLKELEREFPADLQVIWKNNALTTHTHAAPAAIASVAAARQGKFWEFHDLVFENATALEQSDLETYATRAGLDLARFKQDVADPSAKAQVDYERALAESLEARGTPAFFVNGVKSVGWGSYYGLRSQVQRAINDAKAKLAAGTPRAGIAELMTATAGDEGKRLAAAIFATK